MSLMLDLENKKYDKRLLDLNLRINKISKKEHYEMIGNLKDEQDNATTVELTSISSDESSAVEEVEPSADIEPQDNTENGYPIQ